MKNKIEKNGEVKRKLIKVHLDQNTFVTLPHMSSLKVWLQKYPEAKVTSS